jgi:hypothetical protein
MMCSSEVVFETGEDGPISEAITISSICNKVFRTGF